VTGGRLAGRVALVTGAGGGIGEATARRLAAEGAALVLNDVDGERVEAVAASLRQAGSRAVGVAGDVTRRRDAEALVARAAAEHGRLDVLINNAGVNRDAMSHKMTEEEWDVVLAVNLKGTFLCAQAALPGMRERGWGRVVNTSSISALGNVGQANYAASKAGVIGLTRTLALEYARHGVTVNCVAPGPVMTRMLAGVPEPLREKLVARVPAGRLAAPAEIAAVHAFLASDDAAYITGQVLFVDGGMSLGG
jgi:NAD(P)-dependent dehydrogenase (short-subunit alcohol dehydrogenase family)